MVQLEKTSEHFLGMPHTIILQFQNCLTIVSPKITQKTTNRAISVKLATTTENKSLTLLEQAMDSHVYKS